LGFRAAVIGLARVEVGPDWSSGQDATAKLRVISSARGRDLHLCSHLSMSDPPLGPDRRWQPSSPSAHQPSSPAVQQCVVATGSLRSRLVMRLDTTPGRGGTRSHGRARQGRTRNIVGTAEAEAGLACLLCLPACLLATASCSSVRGEGAREDAHYQSGRLTLLPSMPIVLGRWPEDQYLAVNDLERCGNDLERSGDDDRLKKQSTLH
jgi:hypothetical protein